MDQELQKTFFEYIDEHTTVYIERLAEAVA